MPWWRCCLRRGIAGEVEGELAALGFKVVFDEHGQLTFVRVYRGVLEKGMTVLAARAGKKYRVGRLVQLMADQREEVDAARGPGRSGGDRSGCR